MTIENELQKAGIQSFECVTGLPELVKKKKKKEHSIVAPLKSLSKLKHTSVCFWVHVSLCVCRPIAASLPKRRNVASDSKDATACVDLRTGCACLI